MNRSQIQNRVEDIEFDVDVSLSELKSDERLWAIPIGIAVWYTMGPLGLLGVGLVAWTVQKYSI